MSRTIRNSFIIVLCFLFLPIESLRTYAENGAAEPPRYMRELSRLVAATAREDDFGEIKLTIGESEMEVDGKAQPIKDDENVVPFVDENDELQIPVEVIDEADLNGRCFLSEEELEAQGYAVEFDTETNKIRITEPFGLCRLIVETANGKVDNTYGAAQRLVVSDNRTVLQYADKDATAKAAAQFDRDETILNWCPDFLVTADAVSAEYKCWGTARAGADSFMQSLDTENAGEVIVAVLDTGVDMEHPFLQGRILDSGWDFANDDDDPTDDHFHGTHCAGIICDATPENVKILPIKILDQDGIGSFAVIEEAMRYAADSGADVLSMSFGGNDGMGNALSQSAGGIQYARRNGAVCVAAAGNESADLEKYPVYPANIPQAFTVASTGENDLVSYFSNYGTNVDIAAPGENVLSSIPGGKFYKYSGTSMATPLVAACAALLKTEDDTRTPDEIESILRERAKDRGDPGRDDHYGAGVVWLGDYVPLERASFLTDSYTMYVHDLKKLSLYYTPTFPSDNTVAYASSDPSVVEVRNTDGYLKALQPGAATVTATTTEGGLQTAVRVTVLPTQPLSQCCPCTPDSLIFLKADGTAACFGTAVVGELGYYTASADKTFFPFYKDADTVEQDIAQFFTAPGAGCSYYTKTDGSFWRSGASLLDQIARRFPHQLYTQEGTPLRDVIAVNFDEAVLRADGTVWLPTDADSSVYRMLCKEDGTPLTGVVSIEGSSFARCADGSCWTWIIRSVTDSRDAMAARPLRDGNEDKIEDVQQAYVFGTDLSSTYQNEFRNLDLNYMTFLKTDGTVWAVGNNTNGQLSSDTLLGSASPVPICTAEDTPLSGVVQLIDRAALRADGTLWVWGGAEGSSYNGYNGWMGIGPTDGETRGYAQQPMIDADTPLDHVKDFWFNGRLVVLCEDNTLWWSDADPDKGYMVPMVLDGVAMAMQPDGEELPKRPVIGMSLDVSQRSVQIGEAFTLHADVTPAGAEKPDIVWGSSNRNVAFVDGAGTVYAQSAGTAVITAASMENRAIRARCTVRVEDSALRKIAWTALPTKRQYYPGEPLDTTGGMLQLTFADGHIRRVPFSAADCTGFDPKGIGEQTVNVQYGGRSVNYTVTVSDSAVAAISMQTLPDKTAYYPGEEFTADGAAISVQYADGTTRVLPLTENMFTVPDLSEVGTYIVDVQYGGVSCSFAVSVAEPEVVHIAPDGLVQNVTQGETVDLTDVNICVHYADGSTQTVAVTESMCDYSTDTVGTQTMTVSFGGCSTTFTFLVTAPPRPVAAISMQTLPHVLYYNNMKYMYSGHTRYTDATGYPILPDGGSILVEYADGGTEILPLQEYMCSTVSRLGATKTVTVTYDGCTTCFDVYSDAASTIDLSSIEITQIPNKTLYWVGDYIRTTDRELFEGGRVLLTWKDGTQKEFSMMDFGFNVSLENKDDRLTPGEKTVIVRRGTGAQARTDSYTVQYLNRYESGVIYESYFISQPYKTMYALGETLDVTGGRIGITRSTDEFHDEGDTKQQIDITPEMCSGYDLSIPGTQAVTVDVGYAQLSYTITVFTITAENLQSEIEVGQVTCIQTEFTPYVEDGREIIWSSSDESIATVDEYGRVTGIAPGEVEITAQVKDSDAVASCTVTVVPRTAERLPGDADGDGEVTLKDCVQITRYLVGGWDAVIDINNSDVNGDNNVNLKDVVILRRYLAGGWLITLD